MKIGKILKITLFVFLGLIALLAILPFVFKDKIKAKLDEQIAANVDAVVYYDADKFSLGIFRNFPNLTLTMGDFGVVGKKQAFKGDTLMDVQQFNLVLDIMSVIGGDQIKVKKIYLQEPFILTRYTKEGAFSWDISVPDTTAKQEEDKSGDSGSFSLKIDKWEIENGKIIYDDQRSNLYARLNGFNHEGSGDIGSTIYDLATLTKVKEMTIINGNTTYMKDWYFEAKADLTIDNGKSIYTFKDNQFVLNNFKFGFNGSVAMPDSNINVDITYKAYENTFKGLISLVPAVFMKGYEGLKADGDINFDGYVKGTYNAAQMPAFGLNLKVNNAKMQYPELPTALNDIAVDLKVDCKDGVINNTIIDLKKFAMKFGSNPVTAEALVNGLEPYDIQKCNVNITNLNLEEITKMFPVDSTTLKGMFSLGMNVKGKYSSTQKLMPEANVNMGLKNGYVKSGKFPEAIENINMDASVQSNGDMKTSTAELKSFSLTLDKELFSMTAKVINFDDVNYDVTLKGIIDLAKMTKLFPQEGMTVAGRINADITTKGILSDVKNGKYGNTSTSGSLDIKDLSYVSESLTQGVKLSNALFTFTPEKILIANMDGFAGKSDIHVNGYVSNYMGYLFGGKDTTIHGKMNFSSTKFDSNEWMSDDTTASKDEPKSEESSGAVMVPKDIDFTLSSSIGEVLYDNMAMKNLKGDIIAKDGILKLSGLNFATLGGTIAMDGKYDTQIESKPKFDFDMNIKEVNIKELFKTFNSVQKLAPVAENMDGGVSINVGIKGDMDQKMDIINETLNGAGQALIANAQLKDNKVMSGIASLTKMEGLNPMVLKDVKIKFKIENGKLIVEPFDIKAGNIKMNIGGSQSLDGMIDYKIKMDVPAGAVGAAVNDALSKITGTGGGSQTLKIKLKATGHYKSPKITPDGTSLGDDSGTGSVTDNLKNKAKEEADKLKKEAEEKAKAEADRLKKEAENKAKAEADKLKKEAERKAKEEQERLKKEAENQLKNKIKGFGF